MPGPVARFDLFVRSSELATEAMHGDSVSKKPDGYDDFLRDVKQRVREARVRAALAVNSELVLLCWSIGQCH